MHRAAARGDVAGSGGQQRGMQSGGGAGCRAAVVRDAESPASSGREGLDLGQKSICEHGKGDKVGPTWDSGAHMS
jgi:hypothetical protein